MTTASKSYPPAAGAGAAGAGAAAGAAGAAAGAGSSAGASSAAASARIAEISSPGSPMTAMMWVIGTSSPSPWTILRSVPVAGASIVIVSLSVSISNKGLPSSHFSPSLTIQERIVPSVIWSPCLGMITFSAIFILSFLALWTRAPRLFISGASASHTSAKIFRALM